MAADMQNTASAYRGTLFADHGSLRGARPETNSHHEATQGAGEVAPDRPLILHKYTSLNS